jgi:hypothetical protein
MSSAPVAPGSSAAISPTTDVRLLIGKTPEGDTLSDDALSWMSFAHFMRRLHDDKGNPLVVPWHVEDWCHLVQNSRLLCLMAARDHGKSWLVFAYIAWRMWRHNRDSDGLLYPDRREGNYEVIYFSAILPLTIERFERIQQFLTDNEHLFGDLLPQREPGIHMTALREVWSKTSFRLKNGASASAKSIGSATRGAHPQLVVADDFIYDKNSTTALQRGRVWNYFVGTIMPMVGSSGQLVAIGTPQHKADTLHLLDKAPGWVWQKYRAVDWETGDVLWKGRYSLDALKDIQTTDPLLFSREYQMDPRDDASSIFPFTLTVRPLEAGVGLSWLRPFGPRARNPGQFVVAGGDLAISEEVGADYTVYTVALYDRFTQKRQMLWAERARGLSWDAQVSLIRDLCRDFSIDIFVIEENHFQKWLRQHLMRYPETATRVFGHTTGIEKQNFTEGVPSLKLVLQNDLWVWPTEPRQAEDFVAVLRSEASGWGFEDGKLRSTEEHDDTTMSLWLTERAIRLLEYHLPQAQEASMGDYEDLGIERVTIGPDI